MKKYIILVLLLITHFSVGCVKPKTNYVFDKEMPTEIVLSPKKEVTFMNITGEGFYKEWLNISSYQSEKNIVLPSNLFMNLYPGDYVLKLAHSENEFYSYEISITGYNKTFNNITKEQIFSQEDNLFYVLVTREGCSGCETLKPDSYKYNDFILTYDSIYKNNFYVVEGGVSSTGENEDLTGIDNYTDLINNAKMYTPTLLIVENNVITSYYVGPVPISDFFDNEIERIKNIEVINFVIENPKDSSVAIDFVPTNFTFEGNNINKSFHAGSHYSEGSTLFTFSADFFSLYLPGHYFLTIFNEEGDSKSVEVRITGSFDYILWDDIFKVTDSEYYVFFLKTGCPGCNAVKPLLIQYHRYTKLSSFSAPIYAVHRSMNGNFMRTDKETAVGVSNSNDLSLSAVPRVLHIKDGVVVALYSNLTTPSITTLFEDLMK